MTRRSPGSATACVRTVSQHRRRVMRGFSGRNFLRESFTGLSHVVLVIARFLPLPPTTDTLRVPSLFRIRICTCSRLVLVRHLYTSTSLDFFEMAPQTRAKARATLNSSQQGQTTTPVNMMPQVKSKLRAAAKSQARKKVTKKSPRAKQTTGRFRTTDQGGVC